MKILFLSHAFAPAIGGIEASSELLAHAFFKSGHEVRLITTTKEEGPDFPYQVIRKPSASEMIKQHAWADAVYENNPCLRLGWPKIFFNKPSIVVLQTWISRVDGSISWLDKLKLQWLAQASRVIAISEAVRLRCWPAAVVIGNSYDNQLFGSRPVQRHHDFVFLGRLVSDKGIELAIKAFSEMAFSIVLPKLAQATLTIIGDGPDRNYLEHLIAELPDPSRIRLMGPLKGEALVEELNRHTFQFIPSIWEEPFGIVALEGIACGLIPIASDGGGLPDAVGQAGVIFKRGQLDSLVAVTTALLQSPMQQAACRAAAQSHLISFSTESITQKFLDELEAVVGNRSPSFQTN
jgi:glycosyltransferase involved in cell wall biosynthesis